MKKLSTLPILLVGIIVIFQSCAKESPAQMVSTQSANQESLNVINIKLAPNELYQLSINNSSSVSIAKQASHYKVSQTAADTKSNAIIYSYMPATDYSGDDEIMLSIHKTVSGGTPRCGNGRDSYSSVSNTVIKFKVNY